MRSTPGLTPVISIANIGIVIISVVALLILPFGGNRGDRGSRSAGRAATPVPSLPTAAPPPPVRATEDSARQAGANELGLVPVMMYHRILRKRLASIDRTPVQLRQELEKLAGGGYVPITAAEFVSGAIDIPAGTHPVVLTFDDGSPTHFALDANGMPKKDTAVGIIYDVARKFPGFRPVATFWINKNPFGFIDRERQTAAVRWLVGHGFEVANHTYGHPDLHRLSTKKVSEAIVRQERFLRKVGAPGSATFALPYGSRPINRVAARKGKWDGTGYDFDGVFLAGAEPAISPHAKGFDPFDIPRIQSNGKKGECRKWCSQYWLEWLGRHSGERYTSDGDPARVSMPRRLQGKIQAKLRGVAIVY